MKLSKQQERDVATIIGVPTRLIKILSHVNLLDKPPTSLLQDLFDKTFSEIKLKKGAKILDLACGEGSISIPLACQYKVQVDGYDILPGFVNYAKKKSKKEQVSKLCTFNVLDVREAVKKSKSYDVVL